jgi:hypothetical protein
MRLSTPEDNLDNYKYWQHMGDGEDITWTWVEAADDIAQFILFEPGDVELLLCGRGDTWEVEDLTPEQQEKLNVLMLCEPVAYLPGIGQRRYMYVILDGGYSSGTR